MVNSQELAIWYPGSLTWKIELFGILGKGVSAAKNRNPGVREIVYMFCSCMSFTLGKLFNLPQNLFPFLQTGVTNPHTWLDFEEMNETTHAQHKEFSWHTNYK